jgi:signal transduction histidine kinase
VSVGLAPEVLRLRSVLRDLVALFSVPAVWVDREPVAVAEETAEVLVGLSQVDFAFVRLCDSAGCVEASRGDAWPDFAGWLERHPLRGERPARTQVVPDLGWDDEPCRGIVVPIGVGAERGLVAAASGRAGFPGEIDQLLLALAANHAATAFQNARLLHGRKRAQDELREARDELAREQAALRRVAALVAGESSPRQLFAAVAEQVAGIIDVPLVGLVRFEPDGPAVELVGGWSENVDALATGTRWLLDGPDVLTAVWESGRSARFDDYTNVPGEAAAAVRKVGMRSAVASPITVEGRRWGAIAVFSPWQEPLPESTETRLAGFTELLAAAIANADSRLAIARLADEHAALRRVATLVARGVPPVAIFSAVSEEVQGLFGLAGETLDVATVVRFDPGPEVVLVGSAKSIEGLPVGSRWPPRDLYVSTRVLRTGRSARVEKSELLSAHGLEAETLRRQGLVSQVGSPISVEGRLWGAITVNAKEELPPGAEERLEKFTELVSTAIANSDARDQVRHLLDEQSALRRVATLVAEGASAGELFSAVAAEVAGVIGVPVVGVHRYEPDATFTTVGVAGDTSFAVGSRWPVESEGLSGTILASGRAARKDDYSTMPGPVGAAVRNDRMASMVGVPIVVDGSIWGFMVAGGGSGAVIPAGTEAHLARFTELLATAVSNATIRDDLIASRARVVAAADETRRRIERDLHDGAQQQLVTLALELRAAAGRASADTAVMKADVARFADRLTSVIDELREMSRGIHPAILTEGGLAPAVDALARRSTVPVELEVRVERRFPDAIEVAAYYVISEALTNVAKHAAASRVEIRLEAETGALRVAIRDDGVGGADPTGGSGLIGLRDRVEALGGSIAVASPPGGGTRLDVEFPLGTGPSPGSVND